jgi:hypothetical protein
MAMVGGCYSVYGVNPQTIVDFYSDPRERRAAFVTPVQNGWVTVFDADLDLFASDEAALNARVRLVHEAFEAPCLTWIFNGWEMWGFYSSPMCSLKTYGSRCEKRRPGKESGEKGFARTWLYRFFRDVLTDLPLDESARSAIDRNIRKIDGRGVGAPSVFGGTSCLGPSGAHHTYSSLFRVLLPATDSLFPNSDREGYRHVCWLNLRERITRRRVSRSHTPAKSGPSERFLIPTCLYGDALSTRAAWYGVVRRGLQQGNWEALFDGLPMRRLAPDDGFVLVREGLCGLCEWRNPLWRLHWVRTLWDQAGMGRTDIWAIVPYLEAGLRHFWFAVPFFSLNTAVLMAPQIVVASTETRQIGHRILSALVAHLAAYSAILPRLGIATTSISSMEGFFRACSPYGGGSWAAFLDLLAACAGRDPQALLATIENDYHDEVLDALIGEGLLARTESGFELTF